MKYDIEYIPSEKYFVVRTEGDMVGDAFIEMAEALLSHRNWRPHTHVLFDHQRLHFDRVTVATLEKIRGFHRRHEGRIGNGRSAIVTRSGLSSAWNSLWEKGNRIEAGNTVRVFDRYEEAWDWIREK